MGCVRLDRLRDPSGALAARERLGDRRLGPVQVAAVALCDGQARERAERHLRPADLLGQFPGESEVPGRCLPVSGAPAQAPARGIRETELADQALAFGELGARVARASYLIPVAAVKGQLRERGLELDLGRHVADPLGDSERLHVALLRPLIVTL